MSFRGGIIRSIFPLSECPVCSGQGFRTLDDIRTKASLTNQQAIGLKHYNDFLERMPREEAAGIEQTVSTSFACEDHDVRVVLESQISVC